MSGDTDDNLPIDYYQVYRNAASSSISSAMEWAVILATPIPDGKDDTVRAVVSTNGDDSNAYYWVAAVKGELPPGVSTSSMAKVAGENVIAAIAVEASPAQASADLAVLTKDGRLISPVSPGNKARAINNNAAASLGGADFNADKTVDILDIGIMLDYLNDDDEYDPVFLSGRHPFQRPWPLPFLEPAPYCSRSPQPALMKAPCE